ncbi:DUF560 domain-containing protein [Vibrio cholerae]|uniref:porin family protein n=1 Tax=Vibrio cholerae TaxID=666 RepID=UPI0011D333E7|nr:porin family protein [Vibrio cholerae]EGR0939385.1 DUF560 domain-containing protein [Vibrio cholerae]EIA0770031.1 DUF560 domain-containing protein [Vibrio cholerae]EID0160869.1 DUF560 domain-containing protein [Vibrio cholerae]EJR0943071.1 DUF560 domain-containing protein [Vibrio cholerae]EJT3084302.1 DUF560 domain-containing protein [Vibrio cholerae]
MKKMLISLLMFLFYFLSYTCFANINSLEKHDDFELIVLAQDKMQDNQWEEAIKILRYSVAKHPKNNVLRLQLAISLFKNNEFNDSLKQLLRVRAAEKNKYILSKIDGYIDAIRGAKKTSYNIHLSYETDDNVNGVPRKNFGGWRFQTPKKDNYINYYLSSTSTLPISNGFGIRFDSTLYGKKYRKESEFNKNVYALKVGPIYNTTNSVIYAQLGGERHDAKINENKFLLSTYASNITGKNKKLSFFVEAKFGEERHKELLSNLGYLHFFFPWNYVYSSIGFRLEDVGRFTINKDFLNFHWGYDWDNGISTIIGGAVSYQYGNYRDIFGVEPRAVEIEPDITLWYRNLSFGGLTPRLKISFLDSHSDHPLYDFHKLTYSVFLSKAI